jgi:hypothetical protein
MHKIIVLIILLFSPVFGNASEQENITPPKEVAAFLEKRDLCDHFRGEPPYDEERRIFIQKNMVELCTGSDQDLANLKTKYRNNPTVLKKLSIYEEDIEPNNL